MTYKEMSSQANLEVYNDCFKKMIRGKNQYPDILNKARDTSSGTYFLPTPMSEKYTNEIFRQSIFRQIGTYVRAYGTGYKIYADECNDLAEFVPEGGEIPIYDMLEDFNRIPVGLHKLAVFTKINEDFVNDATFDIGKYLVKRFARNFNKAEENAFINGTGVNMPTGILNETGGAEVGVETENPVSYEDVVELYFSVDPEYRRNAVWMMNDETAMYLRKLCDQNGNYLWNNNDNTIFGKRVIISNFMPSTGKVMAFGDFSYYWVVGRSPVSVRTLKEKFVIQDQLGYLAVEYLDGKLTRSDAIKVLQVNS